MGTIKRFFYSVFRKPINFIFNFWERGESVICIIEENNRILFVRNPNYPSLWTLPGGRMKRNELPVEAVIREVREETGMRIRSPRLFGDQNSKRGERIISTTHCFYAEAEKQALVPDISEIIEARWYERRNFPKPLSLTAERAIALWK